MSRIFHGIGLALAMSACTFLVASAEEAEEDLLLFENVPEIVPTQSAGRWYLRGDVGYGYSGGSAAWFRPDAGYAESRLAEAHLADGAQLGVGIGYQFRPWLRGDVTAEWEQHGFGGRSETFSCGRSGSCAAGLSARMVSHSLLANAYVDLGTFAGFTPYLGVGAGVSRVEWQGLSAEISCGGGSCGTGLDGMMAHAGHSSLRFTGALMAGIAYDLTPDLKLDIGYRFRHVAGGGTSAFRDGGFSRHDLRVGLRLLLP